MAAHPFFMGPPAEMLHTFESFNSYDKFESEEYVPVWSARLPSRPSLKFLTTAPSLHIGPPQPLSPSIYERHTAWLEKTKALAAALDTAQAEVTRCTNAIAAAEGTDNRWSYKTITPAHKKRLTDEFKKADTAYIAAKAALEAAKTGGEYIGTLIDEYKDAMRKYEAYQRTRQELLDACAAVLA